jgi:hypothetical protein
VVAALATADADCLAWNGAGSTGVVDSSGNHVACLPFGELIVGYPSHAKC